MQYESRVLVVEDDPSWQSIHKEVLTEKGYLVDMAESLAVARESLDRRFYHAAIVDLKLSDGPENADMDGLGVLEHIWELGEGTAVIVASAYAEVSMFEEFRRYGVFGLAEKPGSTPGETLRELGPLTFIKGSINKGDTPDSNNIINTIERAIAEARRIAVRSVWTESPFSFINGISAREVQHAMGGGQMAELRPFIGDLCRPFMPWLQAREKPVEIKVKDRLVGFQTPCWSRALGQAIVIRFGRPDCFEKGLVPPVDELNKTGEARVELGHSSSPHFEGVVYLLENVDFGQHFRPPAPKRTVKSGGLTC